jgi:hypothetical protein
MSFPQIIENILGTNRVTRESWDDKRHYVLLKDYILQLHKAGESEDTLHPWILSEEDLMGDDWMIV